MTDCKLSMNIGRERKNTTAHTCNLTGFVTDMISAISVKTSLRLVNNDGQCMIAA